MRRRLFAVVSAVSLLLFVATVALWVRSYWVFDSIEGYVARHWHLSSESSKGIVRITAGRDTDYRDWFGLIQYNALAPDFDILPSGPNPWVTPLLHWRRGTISIDLEPKCDFTEAWGEIVFPLWAIALPAAAPAIFFLYTRRRHGVGGCRKCGYNLSGNTSGVCPECGTPVPEEAAEKSPRPA